MTSIALRLGTCIALPGKPLDMGAMRRALICPTITLHDLTNQLKASTITHRMDKFERLWKGSSGVFPPDQRIYLNITTALISCSGQ